MRDILVTAIVLGALPFVFRRAWIGVLLWTWLSVMNPHRLTWGFAYDAPFAAMAAGATLIALFTTKGPVRLPSSPALKFLVAFIGWMLLTSVFAVFQGESFAQFSKVVKIQLMTLVALAVLHDARAIRLFVWVNALSLGFFGAKGGLYTLTTGGGGRVWGPGGFIGGNNEIGLAILVSIPLMYYLYRTSGHRWVRRGLLAAMLLSAVAVLGTQSRGAFLAIAVMSLVLWWRSPGHRLVAGIAITVVGVVLLAVMPSTWHERMATIGTYEQDSSAMGRINAWETALNIANSRVTGAGFEAYQPSIFARYAPVQKTDRAADPSQARAAHSIYFQILAEHGWIGLALFLAIWWLVWREAARIRVLARGDPQAAWAGQLAGMCQVALVGYGVGGAFLSLAYFDLPYNLLVIVLVTHRWLRERAAAPVRPAGATLPPMALAGAQPPGAGRR